LNQEIGKQESLRAPCGAGGAKVAKSALMIFLEVFWKQLLHKEEEFDGIRMPLDGFSACHCWLALVASRGRASGYAVHSVWSRSIRASANSTRYSYPALFPACLPLREDRNSVKWRKPGIESGKSAGQESCGEAWKGERTRAKKSAIMTFGPQFS